jgi:hypothetical protein
MYTTLQEVFSVSVLRYPFLLSEDGGTTELRQVLCHLTLAMDNVIKGSPVKEDFCMMLLAI